MVASATLFSSMLKILICFFLRMTIGVPSTWATLEDIAPRSHRACVYQLGGWPRQAPPGPTSWRARRVAFAVGEAPRRPEVQQGARPYVLVMRMPRRAGTLRANRGLAQVGQTSTMPRNIGPRFWFPIDSARPRPWRSLAGFAGPAPHATRRGLQDSFELGPSPSASDSGSSNSSKKKRSRRPTRTTASATSPTPKESTKAHGTKIHPRTSYKRGNSVATVRLTKGLSSAGSSAEDYNWSMPSTKKWSTLEAFVR
ncbi:unnamed protein product [Amoebophrya sp. A120]|nr:unnamed protein product [Amoebophrya sp. A120]|eukprot:GSA120T00016312001.1